MRFVIIDLPMRKLLFFIFSVLFLFVFLFTIPATSYSDELDDLSKKINDLTTALNMSIKATKPLESQLKSMQAQIADIKAKVNLIEEDIVLKKKNIEQSYKNLEKQQTLLNHSIRDYYIRSHYNSPLLIIMSANSASEITQMLAYQQATADQDKQIITNLALSISDLENKKKKLEIEQERLAAIKVTLDDQSAKLDKVVAGAKAYQSTLSTQIAQLSAKQQQIIAQKLGSLNLPSSLGAGPLHCTDDRKLDPGFGGGFAFFTFGIPHRIGMNQYGAHGRAQAGQSHEDILRAYFDNISFETRDTNMKIKVQGYGEYSLDDYVARIYEMPNSFHIEALKAQAIAARSYALAYTNNGEKEICTTQSCQVFKPEAKGGPWDQAVKDTAGKVLVSGGQVVTAWYASTAGGYLFTNNDVWGGSQKPWTKRMRDTNGDVNSFEDLLSKSYDKDSPCLYAAQGFRNEYGKSAWLKPSETADIVNVLMLAKRDSGTQTHLSQLDKPNPDGTDTWDIDKVKQELKSRGGSPYSSVSGFSIDWDKGLGKVNTISVSGDAGTNSFSGDEFRQYFNLRAPANIQIVGPLYNVEKR